MKKKIQQSNLLMRFYVSDGWTKEELDSCADKGKHCDLHPYSVDDGMPYFIFNVGNPYISEKILELGYIDRTYLASSLPERVKLTDLEILDMMNWRN